MVPSLIIDCKLFFLIFHIKNYPQNHSIFSSSEVTYPFLIFTCRTLFSVIASILTIGNTHLTLVDITFRWFWKRSKLIDKMDAEDSSQEVNYESSQLRIGPYKLKPDEHFVESEMPFKGMFRLSHSPTWQKQRHPANNWTRYKDDEFYDLSENHGMGPQSFRSGGFSDWCFPIGLKDPSDPLIGWASYI